MNRTNYPNGFIGGVEIKGIPIVTLGGKHFFVNPATGSDGNIGTQWNKPLATLSKAHEKMTEGKHDICFLIGNGETSGTARESETLVWSKKSCHIKGIAAPTKYAGRARYSSASGVTYATLMTLSADDCIIENVHMFQDFATASENTCLNVTGQRNAIVNCHIAGGGNATGASVATMSSLRLTGDGENVFLGCTIGLDTIARTAASAEIELLSAAVRNSFYGCTIETFGAAGTFFVKADASGDLDRITMFDGCSFINYPTGSVGGAATMTAAMSVHASAGGIILVRDSALVGCTDWTAGDHSLVYLYGAGMGTSGNLNTGIAHTVDVA